jgi:hypothetical protein
VGFADRNRLGKISFYGKPIKLKGVNHHDTIPARVFIQSAEIEKDIRIFKAYNINAVRSTYPPDRCSSTVRPPGIYVVTKPTSNVMALRASFKNLAKPFLGTEFTGMYFARQQRFHYQLSLGNECHGIFARICYRILALSPIPIH